MYMPTTLPGMSVTKAAEIAADPEQDHQDVPRSRLGLRQGRPRRDRDRSGADRNVRDDHQSQAEGAMAAGSHHRWPDRRDGQGAAVSRRLQCLDHADQGAHRHARDRHPNAGRHQGAGHGSCRNGEARPPDRRRRENRARHIERLRRARDRRLLSRYRARPRCAGALRPDGQRRAGRGFVGARRRDDHDDGRGPRALRRQFALSARPAQRSAVDRARRAGGDAGRRHGSAGRGRGHQAHARPDHHPHRERPARGLHLRRHPRPRSRRLRRRRQGGRGRQGPVSAGLLCGVERPVRISGTRRRPG